MPRLLRPHIPLEVRCRVVLRQLSEMWPDKAIDAHRNHEGGLGAFLLARLAYMAAVLRCEVQDLRLDHNPALGARPKVFKRGKHVDYIPPANDPLHLEYRPHGKMFERSHLIKTNIRGDHGQHPDRVLIKKMRRLERGGKKRRGVRPIKRRVAFRGKNKASRPLRSANRWPERGSQKFNRRKRR